MAKDDPLLGLSQRIPPMNLGAEQALLGALLANNKAFEKVGHFLEPEHFADPIHGRIYQSIARRCAVGQIVDPVILRTEYENSGILEEVGGTAYLAQLLSAMVGLINAGDYGLAIRDAYMRRQLIDVGEMVVNCAFGADPTLDADAQILQAQDELYALSTVRGSRRMERTMEQAVGEVVAGMDKAMRGDLPKIYSTGVPAVDNLIGGGFRPEQHIVLGGRPGHGKSALAMQIALFAAKEYGLPVDFISIEMTAEEQAARAISMLSGVPAWRIELGRISQIECDNIVRAQRELSKLPIEFDDRPGLSYQDIAMSARRFRRKYKTVGMIVVDHMHIVRPDKNTLKSAGLTYAVGLIATQMKELAKIENCPILNLAQLSRNKESADDKTPTMSDLKNSGDIEAAADTVIFTHRPELHLHKSKPTRKPNESDSEYIVREQTYAQLCFEMRGVATLLVAKARKGRTGAVDMRFEGETTSFSPVD